MCVSVGWEDKERREGPSVGPLDERPHLSIPEFLYFNPEAGREEKRGESETGWQESLYVKADEEERKIKRAREKEDVMLVVNYQS